jgi:hypothetical protein
VFWGISGFLGLCVAGWLADKIGRRLAFVVTLIEGAIFITLWVYTENHILLWAFGLAWSFGPAKNGPSGRQIGSCISGSCTAVATPALFHRLREGVYGADLGDLPIRARTLDLDFLRPFIAGGRKNA